jgi:hypothetical protein
VNSTFIPGLTFRIVGELAAVEARHDHVGEQQVEPTVTLTMASASVAFAASVT